MKKVIVISTSLRPGSNSHALADEFNLPIDFEFVVDYHWDLGHGWSEELL